MTIKKKKKLPKKTLNIIFSTTNFIRLTSADLRSGPTSPGK